MRKRSCFQSSAKACFNVTQSSSSKFGRYLTVSQDKHSQEMHDRYLKFHTVMNVKQLIFDLCPFLLSG